MSKRSGLCCAVVAALGFSLVAADIAEGFLFRRGGGSFGSHGGWGARHHGTWGSHGGFAVHRVHHHHHGWASHGSHGGRVIYNGRATPYDGPEYLDERELPPEEARRLPREERFYRGPARVDRFYRGPARVDRFDRRPARTERFYGPERAAPAPPIGIDAEEERRLQERDRALEERRPELREEERRLDPAPPRDPVDLEDRRIEEEREMEPPRDLEEQPIDEEEIEREEVEREEIELDEEEALENDNDNNDNDES